MDCRVKPGNDCGEVVHPGAPASFALDQSAALRHACARRNPPHSQRDTISVNPLRTSSIEIRNMMISVMR